MKGHLLNTQSKSGHSAGSWHFNGALGADQGGRLFNTALAVMTLSLTSKNPPRAFFFA